MEVVLRMSFLSVSNADWEFGLKKLTWSLNTAAEVLLVAKRVELINKCKFAETTLNENANIFVVYVVALEALELPMLMHFLRAILLAIL